MCTKGDLNGLGSQFKVGFKHFHLPTHTYIITYYFTILLFTKVLPTLGRFLCATRTGPSANCAL